MGEVTDSAKHMFKSRLTTSSSLNPAALDVINIVIATFPLLYLLTYCPYSPHLPPDTTLLDIIDLRSLRHKFNPSAK
jgi:hypothetical protein